MIRALNRMRLGLIFTVVTFAALAILSRFVAALRTDWLNFVVLALVGESLLLLLAARHSDPRQPLPPTSFSQTDLALEPAAPEPEPLPNPLGIEPRWLWNVLPTASIGILLFVWILIRQ